MTDSPRKKRAPTTPRPRVRRGNTEDAQKLREDLLAAAMTVFAQQGLDAVSMRTVAQAVGVSPMTPYRYFADKSELLSGLWQFVLGALCEEIERAIAGRGGARLRHRRLIDAFIDFWLARPDHYRLVYASTGPSEGGPSSAYTQAPVYTRVIELGRGVSEALAAEIGADPARARLASDIRLAMLIGFLHAMLVNRRYPWTEPSLLRATYVDQVAAAVERCLLAGNAQPAAARGRSMRTHLRAGRPKPP